MKKNVLQIDKLPSNSILLYYYHQLLYGFMKDSDYTPDNKTLEIFCKFNPGYNILAGIDEDEKSVLVRLHKDHMEDFYKFNMMNRLGEIIQNYTNKLFSFPKQVLENNDQYTTSLYLLKNIRYEDIEIKDLPRITPENANMIEKFFKFLKSHHGMSDSQMGEIFDNFCFDIYSSFNIQLVTGMNSHKDDSLVEISKEHYIGLIQWLITHVEDSYTERSRDSSRFFQMLMVFIWIHHVDLLIGGKEPSANKINWRAEDNTIDTDPTYYLRNPQAKKSDDWKYYSYAQFFQHKIGKKLYNSMLFHGNINSCNCVCSRRDMMPSPSDKRIYDNKVVSFLAIQHFLYSPIPKEEE